ncbi:MAG: UTP--glucose-1-phosphate uridylyltransferase [Xanthomonadales bacterium]|nr:UTP--glucose-1-phosphate uridylyltransferase [Xanthomonadales bacterium]
MNGTRQVRKAVFPVAGLGTRFLPATRAIPKEMLPVLDKPLIQYAVEEAADAGIENIIFVTRGDKQAILDHFEPDPALEAMLVTRGDEQLLSSLTSIAPPGVRFSEVLQPQPLGLGHAVLCARDMVGHEPFAVILPDDMVLTKGDGCLSAMVTSFMETGCSQVGVEEIPRALSGRYGIAAVRDDGSGILEMTQIVEKPQPEEAPSTLGVVGRYVFSADIFGHLEQIGTGAGGEIQLTDAIARLLQEQAVHAFPINGLRFDCGSRFGWLEAQLAVALRNKALAPRLRRLMRQLLADAEGKT